MPFSLPLPSPSSLLKLPKEASTEVREPAAYRVSNRIFGIRDLAELPSGIRDFRGNGTEIQEFNDESVNVGFVGGFLMGDSINVVLKSRDLLEW